jgi:opacity protein-like surface antigen
MEKKLLVVLVVVGLCSTAALALDPMGPPTASLKQGQLNGSLEYSYSEMDLRGEDGTDLKNVRANRGYANLGYGIADNWEAFIRLGGADTDLKTDDGTKYNGDIGFAYGFGTKATFWEQSPELKWGGLFQMSWADLISGKAKWCCGEESVDLRLREIQIGVGPTWTAAKGLSIYGGPFVHFIHGDWNGGATTGDSDITEANSFGGWIGAQVDVTENIPVYVEWQHTGGDADALGVSAVCRF